jgi:hypothetical protein
MYSVIIHRVISDIVSAVMLPCVIILVVYSEQQARDSHTL